MSLHGQRLITAKEAETEIPDFDEMYVPAKLRQLLEARLEHPPEADLNLMIEGEPGTGKTSLLIAYLRRRLNSPKLFSGDFQEIKQERGDQNLSEYDARFFQTQIPQKIYVFVRIDGGSENRVPLENKVQDIIWCQGDHKFVLLDEAGETLLPGNGGMSTSSPD